MLRQNEFYAWALTPNQVAQVSRHEQLQSGLILPVQNPTPDAMLCHFSVLRSGMQHSWLWLFRDMPQAVALRMMPSYLGEDDPIRDLIESSVPNRSPGEPPKTYIQIVPSSWFTDEWDLAELGIDEVWLGFDFRAFVRSQDLRSAATMILSVEEFVHGLRRQTV